MNIMNHVNLCCGTQGMAKTLAPNFTQGSGFMSRCTIPKFRMSSSPISASSKRASAAWKSWNVMNMGWPETRSTITSPHPCHRSFVQTPGNQDIVQTQADGIPACPWMILVRLRLFGTSSMGMIRNDQHCECGDMLRLSKTFKDPNSRLHLSSQLWAEKQSWLNKGDQKGWTKLD